MARIPLSKVIVDKLRERLKAQGIDRLRLPPEPELAREMGVSRRTIRAAFKILEDSGEIWRRQGLGTWIVKVGDEHASDIQIDEKRQRPKRVLVLLHSWGYHRSILNGLLNAASARNAQFKYDIVVRLHHEFEGRSEADQIPLYTDMDAIVGVSTYDTKTAEAIATSGLPAIIVDHQTGQRRVAHVLPDEREGAQLLLRHVASRGHRNILFVPFKYSSGNIERDESVQEFANELGMTTTIPTMSLEKSEISRQLLDILKRKKEITMLICSQGWALQAIIDSLRRINLESDRVISLATYGMISAQPWGPLRVTHIDYDWEQAGVIVHELLQNAWNGNPSRATKRIRASLFDYQSVEGVPVPAPL